MSEEMVLKLLEVSNIHSESFLNCRGDIAPIDVADLAKDIEANGLLQPIVVMTYPQPVEGYEYKLVAGFRRHMAHRVLKKQYISAVIRDSMTEVQSRLFNLKENIQREDLNIKQESYALKILRDLGLGRQDVADALGKSGGWVQVRFMLLDLPEAVQNEAAAKIITQPQIRDLYYIHNKHGVDKMYETLRGVKNAKARGERAEIKVDRKINKSKRPNKERKRQEIFDMMEHIQEYIPNGLYTRCLAWAAGEISYNDLYYDLEEYAKEKGITYLRPRDLD